MDHVASNQDNELYRLALEAAPDALVMVNAQGKIVLVNSQTEKLFGYGREELLGHGVEILVPQTLQHNYAGFRKEFPNSPKALEMGTGGNPHGQRKDGKRFPVEIGLNPIQTEDGACVLSIVDTTDRRRADLAPRESEDRFRSMADSVPVMIWVSAADKLFTFFNRGWLDFTGRTMEQELGNGWEDGVHADDLTRCLAIYESSFDNRRSFQMEYRLRRADGMYRWILDMGVPRHAPGGVFAGYIGACIDITEFKSAQEQAFSRQKLASLGIFINGVAHDFNNLLGSILAEAELALSLLSAGSNPVEEVERIRAVAIRASEIVRELLIYASHDKAELEPVDMSLLVKEMLGLLKVSISKNAILKTDLGENLPVVRMSAAQVRQIIMNLVINSSEAIGQKDGVITVATSVIRVSKGAAASNGTNIPGGDYLRLEVSDSGPGMTEDVQAKIFDPFFTTKGTGRGLGLSVVHGIVTRNGGFVKLISGPGRGTRFEVLLPTVGKTASQSGRAAVPATGDLAPSITGTVLLVEDEDGLRFAVSKMLGKQGFAVLQASDGRTAIDLYRSKKDDIDVILLDMTIPGAPSRDVIAEAQRIRPDVKVILTTAYSREMANRCFEGPPIKGFIRKPYQIDDLVRLLRDVLSD